MTTSWLGNIPFSDEEESDKLNRQIDLIFTKAPKTVGESHPKHKDFYWSGAKWLNVNDLPKSGKAGEVVLPGTGSLYNEDGSKRDLGKEWGEPSSVKADLTVNKAEEKLLNQKSIAATNARSSLLKAASRQSPSKGSVGQGLLTLQQMRNEQTPVQTVENSAPTSTPSSVFNTNIPLDLGTERIDSNLKIPWNNMPKDFNAGAAFTNKGLDLAKAGGKGGLFANAKATANTLGGIEGLLKIASNSQKKVATESISPSEGIDEEFRYYAPILYT